VAALSPSGIAPRFEDWHDRCDLPVMRNLLFSSSSLVGLAFAAMVGCGSEPSSSWQASALSVIEEGDCDAQPVPEPATSVDSTAVCGAVQFVFTGFGTGLYEITIDRDTGAIHGFLQDPDEANRLEIAADAPSVLSSAELASVTGVLAEVTVGRADVECNTDGDVAVDGSWFELGLGDVRFSGGACGDHLAGEEQFQIVVDLFRSHAEPPVLPPEPPEPPTARCEELADALTAKAADCGIDVDENGESVIESCTDAEYAQLKCLADCILEASCGGLLGDDHEAAMGLAECIGSCDVGS
jgi:hypothetical protein